MGIRTSVSLVLQAGTENDLANLIFDGSLSEILDTLDKATVVVGDVDNSEGNVPIDKQDVTTIRLLYIEADGDLDVFLGGIAATTAKVVGIGAAFPIAPVGGETLDLEVDSVSFTVTIDAADTTLAAVIARVDAAAAFNGLDRISSDEGGQLALTSNTDGSGSQVKIVSGTASLLTALGLVAGTESIGKDATPDSDPIRLRQQADPATAEDLKAYFLAALTTSSVTVANPDADNSVRYRIVMVGDLVDPPTTC
jgi:hypothetical protein